MNEHIWAYVPHYKQKFQNKKEAKEALVEWVGQLYEDSLDVLADEHISIFPDWVEDVEVYVEKTGLSKYEAKIYLLENQLKDSFRIVFEDKFADVEDWLPFGRGGPAWRIAGGTDNHLGSEYDHVRLLAAIEVFWIPLKELAARYKKA